MRIPASSVAVFGDGSADIPMLRAAGLGVAIAPSKPAIREAATHCIESGPIDVAIRYLEEHFLLPST